MHGQFGLGELLGGVLHRRDQPGGLPPDRAGHPQPLPGVQPGQGPGRADRYALQGGSYQVTAAGRAPAPIRR